MNKSRTHTSKGHIIKDTTLSKVALTRKEEANKALARIVVDRLFNELEYRKMGLEWLGL